MSNLTRIATAANPAPLPGLGEYDAFLREKRPVNLDRGFLVRDDEINAKLFPFQRHIVRWALARGTAAIFADCGLGKTPMQLEWARHVALHTEKPVLILAPLAVAPQTRREGEKFGVSVTVCRKQSDVRPGVNVANYEMIEHFDPHAFGGVVLDESSILKNFMGIVKQTIMGMFIETAYKLCCTATPAPNDHLELGNHADFLDVMPANEMLMRWFINDTMQAGGYRLKRHAEKDYWHWVSSWAVSLSDPSDLGYAKDGYDLPPLDIREHIVEVDTTEDAGEALFRHAKLSATNMHSEMRRTAYARATTVAEMVKAPGPWVVWCNTNYEADALLALIEEAIEIRGSMTIAEKERKLEAFAAGEIRVLVTKPSICAFGLNWQHCHQMAFVGLSYSYEQFYQSLRRSWRFGQTHSVTAHVVYAETEGDVLLSIQRKQQDHEQMKNAMVTAMREVQLQQNEALGLRLEVEEDCASGRGWKLYLGDSCQTIRSIEDNTVGLSVFSPPFSNLYIYSDSAADMGNAADDEEFFAHFRFLIGEIHRITIPGRLCAVHCKDLPLYRGRDGSAGLKDFPGEIIRAFTAAGWTYHSRVTIWKDPVIEMQRTKNHGLLYKNLREDSSVSRQGMADYLVVFRKWEGLGDGNAFSPSPVGHTREDFPLEQWQRWASPVWDDVMQTRVLNHRLAKDNCDEKHICPLQLDVIERAILLWSNPDDIVFTPFAGIGSELYMAIKLGRKALGIELKRAYWEHAVRNVREAVTEAGQQDLFADLGESMEAEHEATTAREVEAVPA